VEGVDGFACGSSSIRECRSCIIMESPAEVFFCVSILRDEWVSSFTAGCIRASGQVAEDEGELFCMRALHYI